MNFSCSYYTMAQHGETNKNFIHQINIVFYFRCAVVFVLFYFFVLFPFNPSDIFVSFVHSLLKYGMKTSSDEVY